MLSTTSKDTTPFNQLHGLGRDKSDETEVIGGKRRE